MKKSDKDLMQLIRTQIKY